MYAHIGSCQLVGISSKCVELEKWKMYFLFHSYREGFWLNVALELEILLSVPLVSLSNSSGMLHFFQCNMETLHYV